jgi:multidrug efflux system outer membrane protein
VSGDIVTLFNLPNAVWSVAANASAPLFTGGLLSGNLLQARAAYDEAVANYREQVLVGFKEVEDGLAGLRILREQEAQQNTAVESSKKTAEISTARYKEGLANYLEVIDAQRTVLENEQLSAQLREQRLLTTVQLIQALGGGWQDSKIYSAAQGQSAAPPISNH